MLKSFYLLGLVSLCYLISIKKSVAQTWYVPSDHVEVKGMDQRVMDYPWDGGTNSPQFNLADLNNDGIKDLVIYEPYMDGVATYLGVNNGGVIKYKYEPKFAKNFPQIISYLILADYNCDDIPDLFERGRTGFNIYKGYYNAQNELSFTHYKEVWYRGINAYIDPGDIPGIVDIDDDGDLDLLAFNILGGFINFFQNLQVENNLPCDSFVVDHTNGCWGGIYQGFTVTQTLGANCVLPPMVKPNDNIDELLGQAKTTHSGNTLCFTDFNDDGIYDFFNGGVTYQTIQFLTNGKQPGITRDTIVAQDTAWGADGHVFNVDVFPAAFWLDWDQDGDKDLVMGPHNDYSENIKGINYYRNDGSKTHPNWTYVHDSFFVDQHIDNGMAAGVAFYDYNRDGKPDMFVSTEGRYKGNGAMEGVLQYFENTSTTGQASFVLKSRDMFSLSQINTTGLHVAFGDLDNDGKDDMVVAKSDGKVSFYKNVAPSPSAVPQWVLQAANWTTTDAQPIDVNIQGRPYIADIDGDGKKDLIIGRWDGYISFYKNVGASSGSLEFRTHRLGNMVGHRNGFYSSSASAYFGPIDNSGKNYFLLGGYFGEINRFEIPSGPFDDSITFTKLDTTYSNIKVGTYSNVNVMDVDNDGIREMFVGTYLGGIKLFKQTNSGSFIEEITRRNHEVKLYPNPAQSWVVIELQQSLSATAKVELIDVMGRKMAETVMPGGSKKLNWNLPYFNNGVYTIKITDKKSVLNQKLIINH